MSKTIFEINPKNNFALKIKKKGWCPVFSKWRLKGQIMFFVLFNFFIFFVITLGKQNLFTHIFFSSFYLFAKNLRNAYLSAEKNSDILHFFMQFYSK